MNSALTASGFTVQTDEFAGTATDFTATVAKVRAMNPAFVVFGGYAKQAGALLGQLRAAGVTARFFAGDGSLDQGLIDGAGAAAADGSVVACGCLIFDSQSTDPKLVGFRNDYMTAHGRSPEIFSAEGFDAMTAIVKAVEAGKISSDEINGFLPTVNFDGVSKPITFQPNGDIGTPTVFMYQVKDGKFGLLGTSKQAQPR